MLGYYPNGDFTGDTTPPLLTFTELDGSQNFAPLVPQSGTFEIRDRQLRTTGVQPSPPGGLSGWLIGAETGLSDGVNRSYL